MKLPNETTSDSSLTLADSGIKRIMITGGCGFIGHHFVESVLKCTDWEIIIIDKLSYASNGLERLRDNGSATNKRVRIFTFDLCNSVTDGMRREFGTNIHYIVHMAADTHVDNSISDPVPFIQNNVMSTVHLLEYSRTLTSLEKFFYFSTDEVFGAAPGDVSFKEWDRHKPTNPYSASKSAAENICIAYENTYKVPVVIVNVMNAFGERQHVEKFIPKCIQYILQGKRIDIHTDETCEIPGSRFYIHARNIASAVLFLINNGVVGEKYNVVGEKEVNNLEMAEFVAKVLQKDLKYNLVNYHANRPGHDQRYALDGTKLQNMGWKLPLNFEDSLEKTILWTLENAVWLNE
jgi:dTDP-glucose 4,6-dehydratase